MSDAAIPIPPGIYRIVVAPSHGARPGDTLTRQDDRKGVTLLPPDFKPDNEQLWEVQPSHNHDGNVTITWPPQKRPPTALTYEGEAKIGARVITRTEEFATKWRVEGAPGEFLYSLRVANKADLGIVIGKLDIHPPQLELGKDNQLLFRFQRAHPE